MGGGYFFNLTFTFAIVLVLGIYAYHSFFEDDQTYATAIVVDTKLSVLEERAILGYYDAHFCNVLVELEDGTEKTFQYHSKVRFESELYCDSLRTDQQYSFEIIGDDIAEDTIEVSVYKKIEVPSD